MKSIFVDEFNLQSCYPVKDSTIWRIDGSSPPKKRNKRLGDKKRSTLIAVWNGIIVHYRIFEEKQRVNGDLFLDFIKDAYDKCKLKEKCNFRFMLDDAGHHRKKSIAEWLLSIGSEHVAYPSYSADMFPADYETIKRIFDLMPKGRDLDSGEMVVAFTEIVKIIEQSPKWDEDELPKRWRHIVDLDGDYLPDAYHEW